MTAFAERYNLVLLRHTLMAPLTRVSYMFATPMLYLNNGACQLSHGGDPTANVFEQYHLIRKMQSRLLI